MATLGASIWRLLAYLIGFLLLVALALVGLAVAVFSIGAGPGGLSPPHLADLLSLPALRDSVSSLLDRLEGSSAGIVAVLGGIAAVLVGALLLMGVLAGRRRTTFTADSSEQGKIEARPGPLGEIAEQLTARISGVTAASVRVRPSKRGGKLKIKASHARPRSSEKVAGKVREALTPLGDPFGARVNVRARTGDSGDRVE